MDVYGLGVRVATSKMGGLWVFDPMQRQLARYGYDGGILVGVQLPNNLGDLQVVGLTEQDARLYMGISDGRVLIFDINGTYLGGLGAGSAYQGIFQVWSGKVYSPSMEGLQIWLPTENIGQKLPLPGQNRQNTAPAMYYCQLGRIYVWMSNQLLVFRINDI